MTKPPLASRLTEARKFSRDDRLRSSTPGPQAVRLKVSTLSRSWSQFPLLLSIVVLMVIGTIAAQSALNGVTMKVTVAQKRKDVFRLKEPEMTPAPKLRSASPQRSSLSARYPVNGAWPAEMRIDMLAAYLDFRSVRELVLAVSRGDAPPPTRYRGVGRTREAIWVKVIVDEHVAPGIDVRQNQAKVDLAALA